MANQRDIITFQVEKPVTVTLDYNEPTTKVDKFNKTNYFYGCDNSTRMFKATEKLHEMIQAYKPKKGSSFTIVKRNSEDNNYQFFEVADASTPPATSNAPANAQGMAVGFTATTEEEKLSVSFKMSYAKDIVIALMDNSKETSPSKAVKLLYIVYAGMEEILTPELKPEVKKEAKPEPEKPKAKVAPEDDLPF